MGDTDALFCTGDHNLDPMTLTYKLDLDVLKIHLHTNMNFLRQGFQKFEHYRQTDRQTDTQRDATERITTVIIIIIINHHEQPTIHSSFCDLSVDRIIIITVNIE